MRARDGEIIPRPPMEPATDEKESPKKTAIAVAAEQITERHTIISFRNRPMLLVRDPYPHFEPLYKERFDRLAYPIVGMVTQGRIRDAFAAIAHTAPDYSHNDHLVLFGRIGDTTTPPTVWNAKSLAIEHRADPNHCIWRSPYAPLATPAGRRMPFIMSLAGNDPELYDDIMQSIAPIIMDTKPDGVIWWVGDGANGKSTLMDALYKIFPGQFASLTVKRLVDGRDTPGLNGTLANIVKESSEGRIDDTEIYKAVGTHENFRVHKFHSQDDIEIRGNIHHIFSANNVPAFNDKGHSARRRTFIIPFGQRFQSDPTFEKRTFTPEFFGELVSEMLRYAKIIEKQGFKYKWSAATLAAKGNYDAEANNAEEFAKHLIADGVVAFDNFGCVTTDYERWCFDNGYVALGRTNVRKALLALGFIESSWRPANAPKPARVFKLPDANSADFRPFGDFRGGLYTIPGFERVEPEDVVIPVELVETDAPLEPDPEPAEPERKKVLNNWW